MDEVSVPPRSPWRSVVLNAVFGIAVALAVAYILWRGVASESTKPPTPLFGQTTVLEFEGHKRAFRLVAYANIASLQPGDMVIREKEPAAVVWRVVTRDRRGVRLERHAAGRLEQQEVPVSVEEQTARYILVEPAPGRQP